MNILAPLALALALSAPAAQAAVVNFDDLPGDGIVADGYGGIIWGGDWSYYSSNQDPYNPSSGDTRIYTTGNAASGNFSFGSDVVFGGAYISGFNYEVIFELFLNGTSVALLGSILPSSVPTLVGSGYGGLVDEVRVSTTAFGGFFVLDDVTYNTVAPVPLPAAGLLLLAGLGGLGLAARRRRAVAA